LAGTAVRFRTEVDRGDEQDLHVGIKLDRASSADSLEGRNDRPRVVELAELVEELVARVPGDHDDATPNGDEDAVQTA
jgi:hypothetical protein